MQLTTFTVIFIIGLLAFPTQNGVYEKGKASYYADKFKGRPTASGAKYMPNKLTAAHKKLPFGTLVKVTNLKNGKSVKVTINDRGPFIKGRIIDLSKAAAKKIDLIKDGVVDVEIKVLK
ncbi:MAG: septal ring lytic transglycosylase RlpA family protein [Bacteroidota bacterium]